jgi:hypothetical protein
MRWISLLVLGCRLLTSNLYTESQGVPVLGRPGSYQRFPPSAAFVSVPLPHLCIPSSNVAIVAKIRSSFALATPGTLVLVCPAVVPKHGSRAQFIGPTVHKGGAGDAAPRRGKHTTPTVGWLGSPDDGCRPAWKQNIRPATKPSLAGELAPRCVADRISAGTQPDSGRHLY